MKEPQFSTNKKSHVPWGAFLFTVLLIGGLFSILSENLTFGPSWTVLSIVIILFIPMALNVVRGQHKWTRAFALGITGVLTFGLITSVAFLIYALFHHKADASSLFKSAVLLYVVNIGVFSVWYWEIDRGGPLKRHSEKSNAPDFLFPQMTFTVEGYENWTPLFLDYLYLAFNTNTAFSPTDTMILSKKAKVLMTVQSGISLLIVAVVAARAVNIV